MIKLFNQLFSSNKPYPDDQLKPVENLYPAEQLLVQIYKDYYMFDNNSVSTMTKAC